MDWSDERHAYRECGLRSAGPARSACGGHAPTSLFSAHSRSAAVPSDPSLRRSAYERRTCSGEAWIEYLSSLESLTQNETEIFQLNYVPRQTNRRYWNCPDANGLARRRTAAWSAHLALVKPTSELP